MSPWQIAVATLSSGCIMQAPPLPGGHQLIDGVQHKHCSRCAQFKHLDQFPRDRKHNDGMGSWCKPCANANMRERRAKQSTTRGGRCAQSIRAV
jgi:alpha-D-ribose 1-methylphosphonate 5-triphosphate synthase subunit PhnG